MRRGALLVGLTATLTVTRYALIADTVYRMATAQADTARLLVIGVLTVTLWCLNGVGLVALFRRLVKRIRRGALCEITRSQSKP